MCVTEIDIDIIVITALVLCRRCFCHQGSKQYVGVKNNAHKFFKAFHGYSRN